MRLTTIQMFDGFTLKTHYERDTYGNVSWTGSAVRDPHNRTPELVTAGTSGLDAVALPNMTVEGESAGSE